jgi:hypothetical protein
MILRTRFANIKELIARNKLCFVLLIGTCSLFFSCITVCENIGLLFSSAEKQIYSDGGYIYIDIQHESDPTKMLQHESILDKFKTLHTLLSTSKLYSYYEIYAQPIYLSQSQSMPSIQISQNVQTDFGLQINEGRLLDSSDFVFIENSALPVIAGNDYMGTWKLGDSFVAEYLFHKYTFEIVGFLSEGIYIERSSGSISLNEKIIIPSFAIKSTPRTETERVSSIIHYANKTSGKIKLAQHDFETVYEYLTDTLDHAGVGSFSCHTNSMLWDLKANGIDFSFIYIVVIGITVSVAVVFLILNVKYCTRFMRFDVNMLIHSSVAMTATFIISNVISAAGIYLAGNLVSWEMTYSSKINILISIGILVAEVLSGVVLLKKRHS